MGAKHDLVELSNEKPYICLKVLVNTDSDRPNLLGNTCWQTSLLELLRSHAK